MNDAPRILIPRRHRAAQEYRDFNTMDDIGGMNAAEVTEAQYEFYLAQKLGKKLMQTYPQRQWGVQVNVASGSATITCPSLSATKGYVIHLHGKTLHDLETRAVYAAGEILERFGLSRGRLFDPTTIELLPRDRNDEAVSPDSAAGFNLKSQA